MAEKNNHWNKIRHRLQPPAEEFTDFGLLEELYRGNPIIMVRPGDGSRYKEDSSSRRRTISFIDGSLLRCTERRTSGVFFYHYEWQDQDGCKILALGSEDHGKDKRYQTSTDPHHIHYPSALHGIDRLANGFHRDLFSIVEMIKIFITIQRTE